MPEVRIRWAVAGDVLLDRAFTRLSIEIKDFTPALRDAGDVIYTEIEHQFSSEGDPSWQALSPRYAARKARKYPGKPILQATGAMHDSLTDPAAPGAVYDLTPVSIRVGSDLRVGRWCLPLIHYAGADRAGIPERPMVRLRPAAKSKITRGFRKHFENEAKKRGINT